MNKETALFFFILLIWISRIKLVFFQPDFGSTLNMGIAALSSPGLKIPPSSEMSSNIVRFPEKKTAYY
jgi:hypothetical protein